MEVHPHESSKEYCMRVQSHREGPNDNKWEDCRILKKFKIKKNGRESLFCTVECRLRKDLGETMCFQPEGRMK